MSRALAAAVVVAACAAPVSAALQPGPPAAGWLLAAGAKSPAPLVELRASFTVPAPPRSAAGQLVYLFPALVSVGRDAVLQPVLQWGVGPAGGGERWLAAAWSCSAARCVHGPYIAVEPGDVLWGHVLGRRCSTFGACDWELDVTSARTGESSPLLANDDPRAYVFGYAGVLEVYGVAACDQLPEGGRARFMAVEFTALDGSAFAPQWQEELASPHPCANLRADVGAGGVDLRFDDLPPPRVALQSPAHQSNVAGEVTLVATATAGAHTALAGLELAVDGALVQRGASSPQEWRWDTRALANGSRHRVVATARDASGASSSASAEVIVRNAPAVALTSPAAAATVSGLVQVAASGSAPSGAKLASLQVEVDGAVVARAEAEALSAPWDTRALDDGRHLVTAVAVADDLSTGRTAVWVEVRNASVGDPPRQGCSASPPGVVALLALVGRALRRRTSIGC